MDSIDLARVERRARLRYELARVRRAVLGFAPVLVLVGMAALLGKHRSSALAFGASMFAIGAIFLWYGRDLKRAVLPGLGAGLVPLVLALCANHVGHGCTGDGCMMLCVPACTVGGVVAGLAVASIGVRRGSGVGFWLGASTVAVLTGAMGCSCVGYSGVFGLALGYAAGTVPRTIRHVFGPRPS